MHSTAFWSLFVVLLIFWLYCVTTVTTFIDLAGSWTSRNKNAVFFAEIQIRSKFFSSSPRGKPLLPFWEIASKKRSIISPSNRASGFEFQRKKQRSPVTRHRRVTYSM